MLDSLIVVVDVATILHVIPLTRLRVCVSRITGAPSMRPTAAPCSSSLGYSSIAADTVDSDCFFPVPAILFRDANSVASS